jgi:hypothetical protein
MSEAIPEPVTAESRTGAPGPVATACMVLLGRVVWC